MLAQETLTDWRYVKPVSLPDAVEAGDLVEIVLDADVFAGSQPRLDDLRVIAGEGVETAYKLEVAAGARERASLVVAIQDVGYVPGEYTTFVADLGPAGILHNEIEIRTPELNFRWNVTVAASRDRATWANLSEQEIFDFSDRDRGVNERDTRVTYPESTARYLRIRIGDSDEGELKVSGAAVSYVKETPPVEVRWPVAISATTIDPQRRVTVVDLDLGREGLPVNRLVLTVPNVNFYREVDLRASADQVQWRTILSGAAIYAYDTPKFVGGSLSVSFAENTSRYLQLLIHDEDNPPIDINSAEAATFQRRIVFAADPAQSYRLFYSNAGARPPSYDIERFFQYLDTGDLPRARLGDQITNPLFAGPPALPLTERLSWLIPVAVSAAAVVVGLFLFGVLRKARKLLPPPAE